MAAGKYLDLDLSTGHSTRKTTVQTSAGPADEGKIPSLDASGKLDITMMPSGVGPTTFVANASENLAAGDLVNIWDDAGTVKIRKADANALGKAADGFVIATVTSGNSATAYLGGAITGLTGLTKGAVYFLSTTAGGITTDVSGYATNDIVQCVGKAVSTTDLAFKKGDVIVLG